MIKSTNMRGSDTAPAMRRTAPGGSATGVETVATGVWRVVMACLSQWVSGRHPTRDRHARNPDRHLASSPATDATAVAMTSPISRVLPRVGDVVRADDAPTPGESYRSSRGQHFDAA